MSDKEQLYERLHNKMAAQIERISKNLAPKLFPEPGPDVTKLDKVQHLEFVRRHWGDPNFRLMMLDWLAPKFPDGTRDGKGCQQFLDLAQDVLAGGVLDANQPNPTGSLQTAEPNQSPVPGPLPPDAPAGLPGPLGY